jgi:uncharacterized protein (TIGR03067 family)
METYMKMISAFGLLVASVFLAPWLVLANDNPPMIDGDWTIESFTLEGKPVDQHHLDRLKKTPYKIAERKMTLGDGGTWIKTPTGDRASNGAIITFDDSKSPGVVKCEMLGYDGWHGIYKIDDDKLTICRCSRDEALPTSFESTAENKWQLRTYVRSSAAK